MNGAFRPSNEKELCETIRGCARDGRRVRLSGGGVTARRGTPETLGVWLDGISGVVEIRADDLAVTALAGTSLSEVDAALREKGRRLAFDPWDGGGRSTIGGAIAAAADGLRGRLGFRARDALLGARAVLGNGDAVCVGARVVKSVAGFDVCKALAGSRGCLAAITQVTSRIEAVPETTAAFVGIFDGREDAHAAVTASDALPLAPSAIALAPQGDDHIWLEVVVEGPRAAVAAAARRLHCVGLREREGDIGTMCAFVATDARAGRSRVVGAASRTAPLDALPADVESFVVDVLRGRYVAHVPERDVVAARATPPLVERIRKAFDPTGVFEPGRGIGAT